MKRCCSILVLTALTQAFVFGQSETEAKRWHFGAFAGPQLAFSLPKQSGSKPSRGMVAGVDVGYRFQNGARGWSAHVQPNFSLLRNSTTSGDETTVQFITLESEASSVHLPFFVRYTFMDGKIRPFAEAGGNWAIRTNVSYQTTGRFCPDGAACTPIESDDKIKNAEVNRIGALISAGVQIDAGKAVIPITLRVIQDVIRREIDLEPIGGTYRNPRGRLIQLTAGITF
ncbi:MAG: outer membrane beta-barrel protein [Dyadobacter fermentans]